MIWWFLAFGAFVWWIGMRLGEAFEGLEGSKAFDGGSVARKSRRGFKTRL